MSLRRPPSLTAENTPIWVVMTGNVRSGKEFLQSFEQVDQLRKQGLIDGILFCTWQHDLDAIKGLEQALVEADVRVLSLDPPSPNPKYHPLFWGFLYHQRKSLRFALDSLPADAYVIKTRTDYVKERFDAMIEAIFGSESPPLETSPVDPILQTRIFTFDARTDCFFYWDDIVFNGTRDDLNKLNNFDITSDVMYPKHHFLTETRLFAPLFVSHYPILRWYFENTDDQQFARLIHRSIESDSTGELPELVIRVIAAYFHILSRYVIFPSGEKTADKALSLATFFSPDDSMGVISYPMPWPCHKCCKDIPFAKLHDPDTRIDDPALVAIIGMMDEMDRNPKLRGEIPANFDQLIHEFENHSKKQGLEVYAPQYSGAGTDRPQQPTQSASLSTLYSLDYPEKRRPSKLEYDFFKLRVRAAYFLLRILS